MRMAPGQLMGGGLPLSQLTLPLSQFAQRMVVDRTGLTGNFDIDLKWTPDALPQVRPRRERHRRRRSTRTARLFSRPCRSSSALSLNLNARPSRCSSSIMLNGRRRTRFCAALLVVALARPSLFAAGDQHGLVTFNGLPVPGATVVATQGDRKVVASSDADGRYRLTGLADGPYTVRVEMLGFAAVIRDLVTDDQSAASTLELALLPFEEIRKIAVVASTAPIAPSAPVAPDAPTAPNAPSEVDPELERQAAEGFLVNGSVNNAAASPFAQSRAFGNNRPGQRSLYNGGFGFTFGTAALDARPFSFSAERAPRPDYTDMQFMGSIGGPFRIPGVRNRPVFFAGYQHSTDHNASAQSAVMPTLQERAGDFSGAREIRDPKRAGRSPAT